ncbi:MAG TPA: SDR family NAD(P)-dependent oxidoreductase, partial [Puia sp.]|nr:SDR family NAD(P)-dependent oxidoreductase [Puia sp.]
MQIYLIFIEHLNQTWFIKRGVYRVYISLASMYSLKNKTAIVTGGGSGIGKAISLVFALAGARVYILDIDENGSVETIDQIRKAGGHA